MSFNEEKIQIVAFSTNEKTQTPNDIIQILLDHYTHTLIKKSRHSFSFTLVLPETIKSSKIMICSVLNLSREYTGITNVNCYLILVDLQNENSKNNLNSIISYSKIYCDLSKTFFVLGIINKEIESKQVITQGDIKKIMGGMNLSYEYIELNLNKVKEVSDYILNIFVKSSKEGNFEENKNEQNGKESNSCNVF